jgi:hypothetical protein
MTVQEASRDTPFSGRGVAAIAVAAAVSLGIGALLSIFAPDMDPALSAQPDGYSRSALGHRAFLELLRKQGIQVIQSRHGSARRASDNALLALIEPSLGEENDSGPNPLREMLLHADNTLVVLPKRRGEPDLYKPRWLGTSDLLPIEDVEAITTALALTAKVVRPAAVIEPEAWKTGEIRRTPTLSAPQLVVSKYLRPIVECEEGILFGVWGDDDDEGSQVWILSDPDVLETHGISDGDNAAFSTALVELARASRGAVIVDETLHGHVAVPGLAHDLFEFPLILTLGQALLALAVLFWAATGRFGSPLPESPPIPRGAESLIDNTAALLRYGGHSAEIISKYYDNSVRTVAQALHAPTGMTASELRRWLDRHSRASTRDVDLDAIYQSVRDVVAQRPGWERQGLQAARQVHLWQQETLDGSGRATSGT